MFQHLSLIENHLDLNFELILFLFSIKQIQVALINLFIFDGDYFLQLVNGLLIRVYDLVVLMTVFLGLFSLSHMVLLIIIFLFLELILDFVQFMPELLPFFGIFLLLKTSLDSALVAFLDV